MSGGAKISASIASPSHQVPQQRRKLSRPTKNARQVARNHRGPQCGQDREPKHVERPFEAARPMSEQVDQKSADERFEHVSCRNSARGSNPRPISIAINGRNIDQKCSHENARPHSIAEHQTGRERDPGRRPDRGDARMNDGKLQAQFAAAEVNGGEQGRRHGQPQGRC